MDLIRNLQHEEGENGKPKHGPRKAQRPAIFLGDIFHIYGEQGASQ